MLEKVHNLMNSNQLHCKEVETTVGITESHLFRPLSLHVLSFCCLPSVSAVSLVDLQENSLRDELFHATVPGWGNHVPSGCASRVRYCEMHARVSIVRCEGAGEGPDAGTLFASSFLISP